MIDLIICSIRSDRLSAENHCRC